MSDEKPVMAEVDIEWKLARQLDKVTEMYNAARQILRSMDNYLNQGGGTSIHCYSIGHQQIKNTLDNLKGLEQKATQFDKEYFGVKK